jgi:hypothetical protein
MRNECVQQRSDCDDEQKRDKIFVSSLINMCACVRSGFAGLLGMRFHVMDKLVCVLLFALACKDNFAC